MPILTDFLTDIADSIRSRKGTTEPINAQDFATEISNLGAKYDVITITENGIHDVEDYKNVEVDVISEADIKLQQLCTGEIEGEFEVPEGTTSLRWYAFASCKKLESVKLPSTLTKIPYYCFKDCSKLKAINIPDGVTEIGDEAFIDCNADLIIDIPSSVTKLGTKSLDYGSRYFGNGSIYLPTSILQINSTKAFPTYSMNNVYYKGTIDEWITKFGTVASDSTGYTPATTDNKIFFLNANGEYYEPNEINVSTTYIRSHTFACFNAVEKIILNEGVKVIERDAFLNHNVKEIVVPTSVTRIEQKGFYGKSGNKTTFIFKSETPPSIVSTCLGATSQIDKIFVPVGCRNAYISASGWSTYANYIIEPNNITVHVPSTILNNETYTYSINQGETWNMFDSSIISLENLTTIRFKNTTADITIKIGNTSGGSEIGTIANAELTHNTSGDEVIYLTIA